MSEVTLETDLKKLAENNNFLNDVVIYKFYNELNTNYVNSEKYDACIIAIQNNINNISISSRKYCCIIDSILKNKDNILKSIEEDKMKDNFCLYLNYWVFDKFKDQKIRYEIIKYVYSAEDTMNESNLNSNSKCLNKTFNVDEKYFKNKKKLFEFLEAFDIINKKLKETGNSKKNEYCNYLQSIFSLYYVMKQESTCNNSSIYKEEIDKFGITINDEVFSLIKEKCPGSNIEFLYTTNRDKEISNRQEPGVSRLENNDTHFTKEMVNIPKIL
ncbi:hypothetical protein PCYB_001900 [Plasmodium cynomolgi strain B]|uniref:CYIR protein n=1 Tax=Plasmodium cynomolgi (strain B) TaxID=1120755 RepID=K6VJ70_PLACD|nr:hypothetical protein PCYB_001900 [Plasmodium cynomolgi strain B]GAB69442.1 hypothetical protein PCYB_001900 [Plasmodium cynomolgi strain B]